MGRTKLSQVLLLLEPEQLAALNRLAKSSGQTRMALMREALAALLAKHKRRYSTLVTPEPTDHDHSHQHLRALRQEVHVAAAGADLLAPLPRGVAPQGQGTCNTRCNT